jgi:putative Mg2+ transporter-C (MgtC) family protein
MESDMILRLVLAMFFGGAIGYMREIKKKAAGLRTHTLVCLGSALFTIVSIEIVKGIPGADPSRIASTVVTGIGFIGAGTIFQSGNSVRGLTTAASIWVCAAIGLAVGAGLYYIATVATILSILVISLLQIVEQKYLRENEREGL